MADKITPETAPVGARLLVKISPYLPLQEVTVLEWSPSERAVKLDCLGNGKRWTDDLPELIEELPPLAVRDQYGNVHRRLS